MSPSSDGMDIHVGPATILAGFMLAQQVLTKDHLNAGFDYVTEGLRKLNDLLDSVGEYQITLHRRGEDHNGKYLHRIDFMSSAQTIPRMEEQSVGCVESKYLSAVTSSAMRIPQAASIESEIDASFVADVNSNVIIIRNSVNASFSLQLDPEATSEEILGGSSKLNNSPPCFQRGGLFHRLQLFLDANASIRDVTTACILTSSTSIPRISSISSLTSYSSQHGSPCYLSDRHSTTISASSSATSVNSAECDRIRRCFSVELFTDKVGGRDRVISVRGCDVITRPLVVRYDASERRDAACHSANLMSSWYEQSRKVEHEPSYELDYVAESRKRGSRFYLADLTHKNPLLRATSVENFVASTVTHHWRHGRVVVDSCGVASVGPGVDIFILPT